jgi:hypothetical protein
MKYWSLITVFLVSCLGQFPSEIVAQVLTPDFQWKTWKPLDFPSYGMKVSSKQNGEVFTVFIEDTLAKEVTRMKYNQKLNSQITEHFDADLKLISQEERAGNKLTFINFQKKPAQKLVQIFNQNGGFLREIYESANAQEWIKVGEQEIGPKAP